jgi:hypothetical protein
MDKLEPNGTQAGQVLCETGTADAAEDAKWRWLGVPCKGGRPAALEAGGASRQDSTHHGWG